MWNFSVCAAVVPRMKRAVAAIVLLSLFTSPAHAGLVYDFSTTSTGMSDQTMSGSVKAEGKNIRIDFDKGDGMLFQDRSFVVSSDGGATMHVVDPAAKTFYQLDLAQLAGGADSLLKQLGGTVELDIRDPKVSVTGGAPGGTIEGFPTKKSSIASTYDIAIDAMGQAMVIRMDINTDVWWTDKIPSEFTNFLQMRGFKSGIAAIDKLMDAQAGAINGFPLKQVTRTSVTLGGNEMTSTSTSAVRNVKQAAVPASAFVVPQGFTRTSSPLERMMRK